MIMETDRLYMRELAQSDYAALCKILQDEEVMYAYEHAFDDSEVQDWLCRQQKRCREYGFGLWAVILKETDEMIGQCGLTLQESHDGQVLEIGYLFQKAFWHKGYATETAAACREYAFHVLGEKEVYSIIRNTNIASQKVAIRNGMTMKGKIVKYYYQMEMPHFIFSVRSST